MSENYDLLIRNGRIVDGSGAPGFNGDIAVKDGKIAAISNGEALQGDATEVIDAAGKVIAPGWVDIHTHYDGQVTWDPYLSPSSWHGVTTVVMGNCGVGFAPVRPDAHDFLIELMESVEDIPGTALHEGIDWQWETFPEYLDFLDKMPRVLDVAAQMPHCALRAYVLGDRAHDLELSPDEITKMAELTKEALDAGAVGFSTSRTILHSSSHGYVPGTYSHPEELETIGDAMGAAGHGVFQLVSDNVGKADEMDWIGRFCETTGRPLTYLMAQSRDNPTGYLDMLDDALKMQQDGIKIVPQVPARPTGMLYGLQSSLHPFMSHPSYKSIADKSHDEIVAAMKDPAFREQLLSEKPETTNPVALHLLTNFAQMFPLGDPPDYEPAPETSVAAVADREGRSPEEVAYEWMMERDGKQMMFSPLASYVDYNLDAIGKMMDHPASVLGLSDGGAHCGLICDVSMPTYLLTHWVNGRERGDRRPLEQMVHLQTRSTALAYGLDDRGLLAEGMKADINIIDLDNMRLHAPEMVNDLPSGARRLVQRADGYHVTICSGVVTYRDGEATQAMPGKLVRGTKDGPVMGVSSAALTGTIAAE